MPSLGSLGGLGGSGWLEKLKRGFEAAGRVVASLARVGRNERLSSEATLAPLTILCFVKSCGRSLGPSGALALARNAGVLLLLAGSGRAALMALVALVLRSRLPLSLVFWNLRTRSSDEPLESSAEMLDPDRAGTFIDSMVRGPVRGSAAANRRFVVLSL